MNTTSCSLFSQHYQDPYTWGWNRVHFNSNNAVRKTLWWAHSSKKNVYYWSEIASGCLLLFSRLDLKTKLILFLPHLYSLDKNRRYEKGERDRRGEKTSLNPFFFLFQAAVEAVQTLAYIRKAAPWLHVKWVIFALQRLCLEETGFPLKHLSLEANDPKCGVKGP